MEEAGIMHSKLLRFHCSVPGGKGASALVPGTFFGSNGTAESLQQSLAKSCPPAERDRPSVLLLPVCCCAGQGLAGGSF